MFGSPWPHILLALAFGYGAVRLLGVGNLIRPGYDVAIQVASPDGLYPRADVDLLGTRVGRIRDLRPGPGSATTVTVTDFDEIRKDLGVPDLTSQDPVVDRFDKIFLRSLRALRDLRWYTPAIVVQNAGQVNVAGQQVTVSGS